MLVAGADGSIRTYMVRDLLCDVQSCRVILEFPVPGAELSQDWVQRLSDTDRPDVPTSHIESQNLHEPLDGIVDGRDRQHEFGMSHEAPWVSDPISHGRSDSEL